MRNKALFAILVLIMLQTIAAAKDWYVDPAATRGLKNIKSVLTNINLQDGDVIVLAPGVYTGPSNVNLEINKSVTIRSEIEPDYPVWSVIDATVIDCQADNLNPNRAFNVNAHNVKIYGITFTNGYWYSPSTKGADIPYATDPCNPNCSDELDLRGLNRSQTGGVGSGDNHGGLITVNSGIAEFKYCVFSNSIVTGGQGGRGGDGINGPWWPCTIPNGGNKRVSVRDGQSGGHGGIGTGNGYGGAIAVETGGVKLVGCVFENCKATGGVGGEGGDGGMAADNGASGLESYGGNGGDSIGDGLGGAVYCAKNTINEFIDCDFTGCFAKTGQYAMGGAVGFGKPFTDPNGNQATPGSPGRVFKNQIIPGGAVYFLSGSVNKFTNCSFEENQAFSEYRVGTSYVSQGEQGGAICAGDGSKIDVDTCQFISNSGSAIYCEGENTIDVHNDYDSNMVNLFYNNYNTGNNYLEGNNYGYGGAMFIGSGCPSVHIQNAVFSNNLASVDGGAIKSESDIYMDFCSFNSNSAADYGGAIDIYDDHAYNALNFIIQKTSFADNSSLNGGAVSSYDSTGQTNDCYFTSNKAKTGGAMSLELGKCDINRCIFKNNSITDSYTSGGAVYSNKVDLSIIDSQFMANKVSGSGSEGGAVGLYGAASDTSTIKNCLFNQNTSQSLAGAISLAESSKADIQDCTFNSNSANSQGGAIYAGSKCQAAVKDCIFSVNNAHAIHEYKGSSSGSVAVSYTLFYKNQNGDFYDAATNKVYDGNSALVGPNNIFKKSTDKNAPVLYQTGPLGNWYLDQLSGLAVNKGSALAVNKGLFEYTTNPADGQKDENGKLIDSNDTGTVDLGYHYLKSSDIRKYTLKLEFNPSQGTIVTSPVPGVYTYNEGDIVTIAASPVGSFRIARWINTDNDASKEKINTVTMLGDKTVKIEFEPVVTLSVPGNYSTIQEAFDAAGNGDTILLGTGVWKSQGGMNITSSKAINFTSLNPDDPCVVASTVIEMSTTDVGGWVDSAFIFRNVKSDTILSGFTIRGFNMKGVDGHDGTTSPPHLDGFNGVGVFGGAIRCEDASPTIKNCIFKDNSTAGGNGGKGLSGTSSHWNGGNGGWSGGAYGGAIACKGNSSPSIQNCKFINCRVQGGNGGDGGAGFQKDGAYVGFGGRGGTWYYGYPVNWLTPVDIYYSFTNAYDEYIRYSGRGGAVYIGEGTSPTLIKCEFIDNRSISGVCGKCGTDPGRDYPGLNYKIDNFGGAVFCDYNSTPLFEKCSFINNLADANLAAANNDNHTGNDDPYISLGGAVACDKGSVPVFKNCHFEDNNSTMGGAIWTKGSTPIIIDCNFASNYAYTGAGIYVVDSNANILRCNIYKNEAQTPEVNSLNPINPYEGIIGDGGGILGTASNMQVFDCNIIKNNAEKSGGGIYIDNSKNSIIHNCLIVKNKAGRDGAGISNNWDSKLIVNGCSIIDNNTTGSISNTTYGGGILSSYNSQTDIYNSIIWGNFAIKGPQVALMVSTPPILKPSRASIDYCNIQGGSARIHKDADLDLADDVNDCKLIWGKHSTTGSSLYTPKFVNGYYLSQPNTGDSQQIALGLDSDVDNADPNILTDPNKYMFRPYRHTTRTDNKLDTHVNGKDNVDIGYHYVLYTPLEGDLNYDGKVDSLDFEVFSEWYLGDDSAGCKFPDYCNGADINRDGFVNLDDFSRFSKDWQIVDKTPPMPNPPAWDTAPTQYGSNSLIMSAVAAFDTIDGYNVLYWFEDASDSAKNSGWIKQREYIASGLTKGQEYGYKFKVKDASNNVTEWSEIGYGDVTAQVPGVPGNLTAKAASSTRINLTWTDNSDDEVGFIIQRSLDGNIFVDINTISANATAYADNNLRESTTYTYRIFAYNQKGHSSYSNQASATTYSSSWEYPIAPAKLRAVMVTDTTVTFTWDDKSINESGFVIERSINGGPFSSLTTTAADVNSYVDTNLTYLTNYSYHVKSRNSFGDSAWSNTINVTTLDPTVPLKPIIFYNPSFTPTDSNNSGQYHVGTFWHHKIVMKKAQLSDKLYYKFNCLDKSGFSSPWLPANGVSGIVVVPGYPTAYPQPKVTYDPGTSTITYDIVVRDGSSGFPYRWQVQASYSSKGTSPVWSSTIQMQ